MDYRLVDQINQFGLAENGLLRQESSTNQPQFVRFICYLRAGINENDDV